MKILLINKYFYQKGGAETVFFQEHNFMKNSGHDVFDFSMAHPLNFSSEFSEYFISNIDYHQNMNLFRKLVTGLSFIYNRQAVYLLEILLNKFI